MFEFPNELPTLDKLFPAGSKVLLTGTGKQFIERIGVDAVREVVLGVMMGENIRTQTEPLTRQRIAQISGAMVALFTHGWVEVDNFTDELSKIAIQQLDAKRRDRANSWLAQWVIGLTGKSVQNVLGGKRTKLTEYIVDFEHAIEVAAERCQNDIGDLKMTLGYAEDLEGYRKELNWKDITRLTTAIGSLTLTIRGSDKSMYGKLFERLVLGSVLTILGYQRVNSKNIPRQQEVFWLSDSSDLRESDATVLVKPGKLVRFDIGFIGPGNSEISKDKLSRYSREFEISSGSSSSITFIIVDRLPATSKTKEQAEKIGAEIVQMSMQYWPRELAHLLGNRVGLVHELQNMRDNQIKDYLQARLATIPIQEFLNDVSLTQLEDQAVTDES